MSSQVQFIQFSPEQLSELIGNHIAGHIQQIKDSIPHSEQLLTREQTADLLQVDLSTLWHWTRKGKLKSYGIGNRVYYKRTEIEASLMPLNPIEGNQTVKVINGKE